LRDGGAEEDLAEDRKGLRSPRRYGASPAWGQLIERTLKAQWGLIEEGLVEENRAS
jgi:hypothetical protein